MKQKSFSKLISVSLIIVVLATMLLFSSCSREGDSGTTPEFKPYIGGDSGVTMEFVAGMPPDTVGAILDAGKSAFTIGVQLTNDGEYDINAESENDFLKMELKGIKAEYYNLADEDLSLILDEDLKAQRKNIDGTITRGDIMILSFKDMSYQSDIQGNLPVNFLVDLCYDYATKSSTRVCVADNVNRALTNEQDRSICEINAVQNTMNSAGPVQVNNLRQSPMGGSKISVLFDVVRKGTGDIFSYEGENQCEYQVGGSETDKIKIQVYLPEQSDATLECSGFTEVNGKLENTVTVFKDSPTPITCRIAGQEGEDNVYVETLNVDLYYRYNEQIKKSVVIQDTGSAD